MRRWTLLTVLALALAPRLAAAKVRVLEPPSRSASDSLAANPPCGGVPAGSPKVYARGTTTIPVAIADGAGDTSLGCFQVVILNAAGAQLGAVLQAVDDVPTTARTVNVPAQIPGACLGGATCTVHVRQLVNPAAGCVTPAPPQPGAGATATYYSCGDFTVEQPPAVVDASVPDSASPDAAAPPTPTGAPAPIPLPEDDAGVRISGLDPGSAETNSCSASRASGAGATSPAALALVVVAGALVRRRLRRAR